MKRMPAHFTLSLFIALAVLAGCGLQPAAPAGDLASFTRHLDQRVPGLLGLYNVPGVSIALVHHGEVAWSQGYGMADEARNIPVTAGTVFKTASLSKAVTAWGIMRLVEQGRLDLDAPVERYLTRWHLPPSQYDLRGVTVRRLLSHTAGISSHVPPSFPLGQQVPSPEEALLGSGGLTAPVVLAAAPGTRFSYTGGGYTILQLLVEEVTGEPFSQYMQHAVLEPLDMQHSSYEWRSDLRPATATGYGRDGRAYSNELCAEQAAAGLYATAPDFARFVAAAMPGPNGQPAGRGLLSPQTLDLMFTPVAQLEGLDALTNGSVGLGHFVETLPGGTMAVTHAGTNWGWQLIFMSVPARGEGIVIFTNGTRGIGLYSEILSEWGDWLGTGAPGVSRSYQGLRQAAFGLAGLLVVGLVLAVIRLVRNLRSGRHQWLWRFSGRPRPAAYFAFAATVLISLVLAAAWSLVAYPLLDWTIGRLACLPSAAVLAWCVYGLVGALLRPARVQAAAVP